MDIQLKAEDEELIAEAQTERDQLNLEFETAIKLAIANDAGIDRIFAISDSDWLSAVSKDKKRNWQAVVDDMTDVQKLVHLAIRQTKDDEERIRAELLRIQQEAYVSELNILAKRAGCSQTGKLTTGPTLSEFSEGSTEDAESIVNTYNFDVAQEINRIAKDVPTANRNTYASRILSWENSRSDWKSTQINTMSAGTARAKAQQDFTAFNDVSGSAILRPDTAKEEVCQGWINRGQISIREATRNPTPFHGFCPHNWELLLGKATPEECRELWLGE